MITPLQAAIRKLEDVPPQTRIEVIRGVTIRKKRNGQTVMALHYSAVPDRDPETEKGAIWYEKERSGYASMAMWKKEQEMDAYATGGEAVFGSVLGNERLYQVVVISDPYWYPDPRWDVVAAFDHGVRNATALLKGYIPRESFNPTTGKKNPPEIYLAGEFYRYRTDDWTNNVDENVAIMKRMPDLERARWIRADPSIFYDAVATDKGLPTNIYQTYRKNNMWPMTAYDGIRSDSSFVEWIMSDYWKGIANGQKPRLYIVCRNPSDRPQPGLHEFDCPNLIWEMRRAKRVEMTSRQLLTKNPSEALQNKNNHLLDCLCADTLISTARGAIAISEVKSGEMVMTRSGWRRVDHAWLANPASEIWTIKFSNGRELRGTAQHRIFIESRDFVRLDAVTVGMIALCESLTSAAPPKLSNGWESTSTDTPTLPQSNTESISGTGVSAFTSWSGYLRTASQFLRGTMFTTWTKIRPTTNWRTSRLNRVWTIFESTKATPGSRVQSGWRTLHPSELKPLNGIDLKREKRGTVRILGGSFIRFATRFVRTAGSRFKIKTPAKETPFALRPAAAGFALQTSQCKSTDLALSAVQPSIVGENQPPDFAHQLVGVSVVEVSRSRILLPTYDLTVAGEHEFFANGLLVHNCMKMLTGTVRTPTLISPEEAMNEELSKLDAFTGNMRARILLSDLARQGKIDPSTGKPKKGKGAPVIDMRRAPGVIR